VKRGAGRFQTARQPAGCYTQGQLSATARSGGIGAKQVVFEGDLDSRGKQGDAKRATVRVRHGLRSFRILARQDRVEAYKLDHPAAHP